MPRPSFYSENAHRAFPFVADSLQATRTRTSVTADSVALMPNEWIVDAGFTMGLNSYFSVGVDLETATPSIYLQEVYRDGDEITFMFGSDAVTEQGSFLTFTRQLSDEPYTCEYADSDALDEYGTPLWSGYLVTGDLSAAGDVLESGDALVRGEDEAIVEPALVMDLTRSYIQGISLANADRTRATAPVAEEDGLAVSCTAYDWDFETSGIYDSAVGIEGDVRFVEGYNCQITQDAADNSITVEGVVGAGAGEPCEEVPLFASETAPTYNSEAPLEGGPWCCDVLRSINGVGGPNINFIAGVGAVIVADPTTNTLRVAVDMTGMAACYEVSEINENV